MKKLLLSIVTLLLALSAFTQITPTPINSPRVATDWWVFRDTVIFGNLTAPYTDPPTVNLRIMPGALSLDNTDVNFLTIDEVTKNMQYRTFSSLGIPSSYSNLEPYQIVFGEHTGTGQAEQADDFWYDEWSYGTPVVFLANTQGGFFQSTEANPLLPPSADGQGQSGWSPLGLTFNADLTNPYSSQFTYQLFQLSYGSGGVTQSQLYGGSYDAGIGGAYLGFYTVGGKTTMIGRQTGGNVYSMMLPNDKGTSGQVMYISSIAGSKINLGWITPVTSLSSFTTTDLPEGTNLYFTDERAQDAVGTIVNSSLTYADATPLLSIADRDAGDITTSSSGTVWTIDNGAVTNVKLANSAITVDGVSTSLGGSVTTTGFTITIIGVQATIADANNYYMGATSQGTGSTADINRIYIPENCVLKSVYGFIYNGGTAGTNESGTFYIRKNNTTDVTVSSSVTTNNTQNTFNGTGLSQSYSAGDYLEGKWLTPTYATNPSNCRFTVTLYFEKI